jgi:hypothetical protein
MLLVILDRGADVEVIDPSQVNARSQVNAHLSLYGMHDTSVRNQQPQSMLFPIENIFISECQSYESHLNKTNIS